ncbi:MAG TPA: hypothetical protein VGT44_00595, partial [Ktedonobacteraceae bacterium]|nr:hypothetical protein [Ktedonobacteraceae bacterium]
HRLTRLAQPVKPRKPRYLSKRTLRTGVVVLGLILLIDIITARYFPQVQSALTLPSQTGHANIGGVVQVPVMKNGVTATTARGTTTSATTTPVAQVTRTATTTPALKQLAQDTFARPDQPLWGTASDGQAWSSDAMQAPVFSIINHLGLVNNGSGIYDAILGPRAANSEVEFSGTVSHFASANMGALLRWTDANNLYKVFIDGANLVALKKVNGVVTVLQSVPFGAKDGTSYTIRARVMGTSLLARAWPTGQAEPTTWMLTATDGDLASGFDGMRLIVQNGITIAISSFLESQV